MEYQHIMELLASNPAWLRPFPMVWGIEYYVDPLAKHAGRGDLVVCDEDYSHFLVVEVKKSLRFRQKLIAQMLHYRDHMKWKAPMLKVDCAAVQDGKLIQYRRDNMMQGKCMFFTEHFRKAWQPAMRLKPPPSTLPYNHRKKRRVVHNLSQHGVKAPVLKGSIHATVRSL